MTTHRSRLGVIVLALVSTMGLVATACSDSAPTVAQDTATTVAQDTATTVAEDTAATVAQDTGVAVEGMGPHQAVLSDALGKRDGGIVSLVISEGETSTSTVGIANADGEPMTLDHQFRVGSISKPFVAVMILQLVEEGTLDLDAPLGAYLEESPVGRDVTIGQLLSHRSGIANYTDLPSFADTIADPTVPSTPAEIVELAAAAESGLPGQQFSYSNTNYILLGQLLEAVDGRSLNDALSARITGPLGLRNTYFAEPDGPEPTLLAEPWSLGRYAGLEDSPYTAWETAAWAAGALVATPDDLATFMSGLAGGELLDEETVAEMTDFTARPDYGLGLGEVPFEDGKAWGHGGGIAGFLSFMAYVPETGDAVVVLTNNDSVDPSAVVEQLVAVQS